ncbi:bifunctional [glutamate--ammonia ligase]-adenylyl-L-tyrosine phosphorylase/[glutamate--ammonia-ligase] adenylyltransferase [Variovorax sp. PCZ-1]|uniref:bifunctional [glutamate--ammonia ligase]-adenylyl-L-tyrosine phosphorylase/[glutamate--ammonia-ligase] adenylyltransferase n=1 Tax=Variovorax sp. PCZ-1 TaxID=2835533 RepID=UPI001BD18E03|nr:bifunctional [glutamate--ammonia ligase]-adenylyl-L-tyrosine phosphorylase/[glutamate--ammonia-ligase] adenylyltransferase [Variovorax sp. PCZ-1]MBS7808901.1 bifunctional [glutamate--ammonia ligase]-adenylyl-L-tyrosine phosphorylase/[glutamate--ammonia-ligase] adenylyltransferase [Variovorax sp. PCZ-1]
MLQSWSENSFTSFSRYATRVRRRYAEQLQYLPAGVFTRQTLQTCYTALQKNHDVAASLRMTRALAMERLIVLDCDENAPLSVITSCMTELAEWSLGLALYEVQAHLQALHGLPLGSEQQASELWIVGMGKLGARELNVSSDIDLIFVYSHEGQTAGIDEQQRGSISNHEYFQKLVRSVCQLLADVSEHGFVFRIDLALRPHGNSGPSAVSLAALEDYFLVSGREWERFAWLKSRVVAFTGELLKAKALHEVVNPFVYRRYLDYSVFEALRQLHGQIREHASRRAAGRPERANDVKLSRGGIRELEFIVQLLQVVRGGQFPELCTRPTLKALQRVAASGLMPAETAQALARAYEFLRRTEHRIQYLDDQQTHLLPTNDEDCAWLSRSMGYENCCGFLSALDDHRELIASEFDKLLGQDKACKGCGASPGQSGDIITEAIAEMPPALQARVQQWQEHPRIQSLKEESRQRLHRLVQRMAQWLLEGAVTETAALRFADWLEPLLRREAYLALLLERPAVHERLLRVLGAARWPQRYLMQHPGVIDELASESILAERFDVQQFAQELQQRRAALQGSGQGDEESLMALLRRAQQAELFRILVRDLEGRISVEQVADDLSALADTILRVSTQWAWEFIKERHREQPCIAIIGYGKLGGKELGYGSDLDIVCLYEDTSPEASALYAKLIRKLISWLSTKTAQGDLYDIDTALRPNGSAGLLVTSIEAFADYQTQRGSNTAWTWEHQAMTRARCVYAAPELAARFESIRHQVLISQRDAAALKSEILAMRERVMQAHRVPAARFDVKHSVGGMVDVEFAVQYLVLSQAAFHPVLALNSGNIALLQAAEDVGLLPSSIGKEAADAYRQLRQAQHLARLDEQNPQVEMDQLQNAKSAVKALWRAVFGG